MTTLDGINLAKEIRRELEEFLNLCTSIQERTAEHNPEGRWSIKEILSHLRGHENGGHLPILQGFLEGECPTINIEPENTFYSTKRAETSVADLLTLVRQEYEGLAKFTEALTPDQFDRKAHVPQLKGSPLGEYPTLRDMVSGLGAAHVKFHRDHLYEVMELINKLGVRHDVFETEKGADMNPVVHFELPYEDRERMAKFYNAAFGWQTQMLGEEMGNYVLATTTESDEKGPKKPGIINGGFYEKKADWPAQYPSVVLAVDDIQAAMQKVKTEGGQVLGEPMEIPGVGSYVSFLDPEGNRLSMLQPSMQGCTAESPAVG